MPRHQTFHRPAASLLPYFSQSETSSAFVQVSEPGPPSALSKSVPPPSDLVPRTATKGVIGFTTDDRSSQDLRMMPGCETEDRVVATIHDDAALAVPGAHRRLRCR
jgi:hypothetical protein